VLPCPALQLWLPWWMVRPDSHDTCSEPCSPAVPNAERGISTRRGRRDLFGRGWVPGAALFLAGWGFGATLGPVRRAQAPAPAVAERPLPALGAAPEAARVAASVPESSDPRRVARVAVAVTAWIRGDGVYGAGVAISDRHVLTCAHVVRRMKSIRVALGEGSFKPASVVARDDSLDLAVLSVEGLNSAHAQIASATSMQMSDPVFAMGNPRNMSSSLSRGIISYAGRPYGGRFYLQTDVATNSGNSGGPVLNERGEVVGIASFVLRNSEGLSFALPIDYAHRRFPEYFAQRLDDAPFEGWLAERHARSHSRATAGVPAAGRD